MKPLLPAVHEADMGWRDINMNRKKPPQKLAFVPLGPGDDFASAVLRKAVADAIACASAQIDLDGVRQGFGHFAAGYMLGYSRYKALKLGVDGEAGDGGGMTGLADMARHAAPPAIAGCISGIAFTGRERDGVGRTHMRAEMDNGRHEVDGGYLVGHLEALCGSSTLLRKASDRSTTQGGGKAFLTDCDIAADPLQTRSPTASLRFTLAERSVVLAAFMEMFS